MIRLFQNPRGIFPSRFIFIAHYSNCFIWFFKMTSYGFDIFIFISLFLIQTYYFFLKWHLQIARFYRWFSNGSLFHRHRVCFYLGLFLFRVLIRVFSSGRSLDFYILFLHFIFILTEIFLILALICLFSRQFRFN